MTLRWLSLCLRLEMDKCVAPLSVRISVASSSTRFAKHLKQKGKGNLGLDHSLVKTDDIHHSFSKSMVKIWHRHVK